MGQGRRNDYCVETLHRLWASGASYQEIAAALGFATSFVPKLKRRHKLPNRQRAPKEIFEDDPTPEEIAAETAKLREAHMEFMRQSQPHVSATSGIRQYALGRYGFAVVSY